MLENIINGIRNMLKKLGKKALPYLISVPLVAFPIACKQHNKFPPNIPQITTSSLPDAVENRSYSTIIKAMDPENDTITYSVTGGTADKFLDVNPNTGEVYNSDNISDMESGTTHDFKIRVQDDKGNFSEKTFLLYVFNTENVNGNVKDVISDSNLHGTQVKLGSNSTLTDINGNYVLTGIPDGNYDIEINDNTGSESNYFTHKSRNFTISKQRNLEGKLTDINSTLIPTSFEPGDTKENVLEHIKHCIRTPYDSDFDIKKWKTCPVFKIYTLEEPTGTRISDENVNLVKNVIQNELYKVDNLFANPTILQFDQMCPSEYENGVIYVFWNKGAKDSLGREILGTNDTLHNGSELTSGYASIKTAVSSTEARKLWMQELTENVIGSGESNIYSSVLMDNGNLDYNPPNYSSTDLKLWKIYQSRPAGNKDLDLANNHDINP